MLSSISRMFRTSPSKNSSPGPTRPDREDFNLPTVSSTAPAETREPIDRLDSSFPAMASAPEKMHTEGDDSDATDSEYVDPFADMIPFSTQVVSDDDDDGHQPADQPAADDSVKASKKKSKKRKHAVAHSDSAETHDSDHSNKKTRKTKKRKTHKPAEDSDDDIMEDQAVETTPEALSERIQSDSDDLDDEADVTLDVSVKSKPRASQRLSVTRQLFQRTKGEAITAVPSGHADNGDDASDADDGVSPSSPSVVAQRRRSMSRGSQISAARQGLSRESTSLPDRISEAAESADESSAQDGDAGDFADQLPPSSQPPQEASSIADQDSSEVDSEDAESSEIESEDQLPRLPVNTARGTLGATSPRKNLITYSSKDPARQNTATPGRARRNAKPAANQSEPGNAPSSAGKSVRSTASRRQRSKPSFYDEKQSEAAHSDDEETAESRIILQSAPSVPPEPSQAARSSSPVAAPSRRQRQPKAESVKSKTSKRASSRVQTNTGTAAGFRSGAFSPEELASLTAAVSAYRDKHGYTQREMNELIQMKSSNVKEGNESGLKFDADKFSDLWNTICPCVPERTRIKIMAVARQQFHNFKARGSGWTSEEDAKLQELKDKHNGSWVLIGANLNRHPNDCRDRYRNYVVCGEYSNRQRWTEEEVKELVEHVMTSLRRLRTTKSAKPLISLLNWDSISAMMGRKRSRLQCIQKFKSLGIDLDPHERLRSLKSSSKITFALEMARKRLQNMAPEDKYTMVKAIFDLGTDKLNWLKLGVSKGFREKYCRSTQKLLWFRLKHRVPDGVRASARECARWLLDDAKANNPRGVKILAGGDDAYDTEAENNVCSRRLSRAPQEKAALSAAKITSDESSDEDDDDEVEHDKDEDHGVERDEDHDDEVEHDKDEDHGVERDEDHDDEVEGDEENETDDEMSGPGDGETQLPDSDEASSSGDETTATSADTTSASQPPDAFTLLPPTRGARKSKDPSPTKKRVRLSGGKSAKVRGDVEDDDEEAEASTPSQSQLGVRKIPDRLQEKKQAARQRISSGSRSRSVVSMPPESPNSNMEEGMPPIRVPASSQPVPVDAPPGTFARKTGSSVLPGQLAEPASEVSAELEAADTAAGAKKRTSKRRRSKEVAESPS